MNPKIIGNNEDGWVLHYEGPDGRQMTMQLDAEDENDAVFEAAEYLEVDEDDIEVEYD
jgi:hypothetical protein